MKKASTLALLFMLSGCAQGSASSPYYLHCTSTDGKNSFFAQVDEKGQKAMLKPSMLAPCRLAKDVCAISIHPGHRSTFWRHDQTTDGERFVLEWDSSTRQIAIYEWSFGAADSPSWSFTGTCRESQIDPSNSVLD